jgi:hypothetical protein
VIDWLSPLQMLWPTATSRLSSQQGTTWAFQLAMRMCAGSRNPSKLVSFVALSKQQCWLDHAKNKSAIGYYRYDTAYIRHASVLNS